VDASEARERFGRWRRGRPFWGGLLLVLAALALLFSANLTLADFKVHFGMEGYLSYVLPVVLLLCGVLVWVTPGQRYFYAIIGLLTSLYSLMGLNLGGFGAGMILGIAGGALTIAWTPAVAVPLPEPPPLADPVPRDGVHKLLAITLVPLVVSAGVLVAGHAPARADNKCPSSASSPPSSSKVATKKPVTEKPAAKKPAAEKPTPTPSPSADDGSGNPIVDGWNDFVDGVGNLFGVHGDSPSASPSPSPSAAAPKPALPGLPTKPAEPTAEPTAKQSADGDVPCMGPRVLGKEATAGGVPRVAVTPGVMEGDELTMYDSTYDGVADIPTATGTMRVLKFSMRKSVTTPFTLTIPEPDGRTTLIESGQLTTTGNVRFYTPRFEGKLFGLIPVTFTPDQPPPLTLPKLTFTDIKIQLAFVRSDTLTGKPLKITELS
jgi:hypothetical protein